MWPLYDVNNRIRYIKYCLILFTLLFVMSGISFIVLGSSINVIYNEYSYFLHMKFFSPSILLTAIGITIFVIACFGLYGSIMESPIFILAFGFFMGVLFILQMSAGITNTFLMSGVKNELHYAINKTMYLYSSNIEYSNNMDKLQKNFHCCGLNGASDWYKLDEKIPTSCCKDSEELTCTYPFNNGCLYVLVSITEYTGDTLTIITYILSGMQLAGMFFAFYLGKMMKEQKRAREAQRWLIREQILNHSNEYDFNIKKELSFNSI